MSSFLSRTALLSSALFVSALIAAFPAAAVNCPREGEMRVTGISVDKSSVMGGRGDIFALTVSFSTAIPLNCSVGLSLTYSTPNVVNNGFRTGRAGGKGQSSITFNNIPNGVDRDTNLTITARTVVNNSVQNDPVSTSILVTAPPLAALTLDQYSLRHKGSGTGKVKIGSGEGGFHGTVTVQLTASPSGLISIPASVRVGEQQHPFGDGSHRVTEYISSFPITAIGTVRQPTDVVITATRLGVSYSQTLTLQPIDTRPVTNLPPRTQIPPHRAVAPDHPALR